MSVKRVDVEGKMSIKIGGVCPVCGKGVLNEVFRLRYFLTSNKRTYFKTHTCRCSACKETVTTAEQFKKNLAIVKDFHRR